MKSNSPASEKITLEYGGKHESFKAKISIFSTADRLLPRIAEGNCADALDRLADCRQTSKPRTSAPKAMYVFYTDICDPGKLGSVAIYGEGSEATKSRILMGRHFFGHRVKRATVELGRRPFLDVVFES